MTFDALALRRYAAAKPKLDGYSAEAIAQAEVLLHLGTCANHCRVELCGGDLIAAVGLTHVHVLARTEPLSRFETSILCERP